VPVVLNAQIFISSTGMGKTFLASVLADQACQNGQTARDFRASELSLQLKLSKVVRFANYIVHDLLPKK
jgi:DNA replication protein DnaC